MLQGGIEPCKVRGKLLCLFLFCFILFHFVSFSSSDVGSLFVRLVLEGISNRKFARYLKSAFDS